MGVLIRIGQSRPFSRLLRLFCFLFLTVYPYEYPWLNCIFALVTGALVFTAVCQVINFFLTLLYNATEPDSDDFEDSASDSDESSFSASRSSADPGKTASSTQAGPSHDLVHRPATSNSASSVEAQREENSTVQQQPPTPLQVIPSDTSPSATTRADVVNAAPIAEQVAAALIGAGGLKELAEKQVKEQVKKALQDQQPKEQASVASPQPPSDASSERRFRKLEKDIETRQGDSDKLLESVRHAQKCIKALEREVEKLRSDKAAKSETQVAIQLLKKEQANLQNLLSDTASKDAVESLPREITAMPNGPAFRRRQSALLQYSFGGGRSLKGSSPGPSPTGTAPNSRTHSFSQHDVPRLAHPGNEEKGAPTSDTDAQIAAQIKEIDTKHSHAIRLLETRIEAQEKREFSSNSGDQRDINAWNANKDMQTNFEQLLRSEQTTRVTIKGQLQNLRQEMDQKTTSAELQDLRNKFEVVVAQKASYDDVKQAGRELKSLRREVEQKATLAELEDLQKEFKSVVDQKASNKDVQKVGTALEVLGHELEQKPTLAGLQDLRQAFQTVVAQKASHDDMQTAATELANLRRDMEQKATPAQLQELQRRLEAVVSQKTSQNNVKETERMTDQQVYVLNGKFNEFAESLTEQKKTYDELEGAFGRLAIAYQNMQTTVGNLQREGASRDELTAITQDILRLTTDHVSTADFLRIENNLAELHWGLDDFKIEQSQFRCLCSKRPQTPVGETPRSPEDQMSVSRGHRTSLSFVDQERQTPDNPDHQWGGLGDDHDNGWQRPPSLGNPDIQWGGSPVNDDYGWEGPPPFGNADNQWEEFPVNHDTGYRRSPSPGNESPQGFPQEFQREPYHPNANGTGALSRSQQVRMDDITGNGADEMKVDGQQASLKDTARPTRDNNISDLMNDPREGSDRTDEDMDYDSLFNESTEDLEWNELTPHESTQQTSSIPKTQTDIQKDHCDDVHRKIVSNVLKHKSGKGGMVNESYLYDEPPEDLFVTIKADQKIRLPNTETGTTTELYNVPKTFPMWMLKSGYGPETTDGGLLLCGLNALEQAIRAADPAERNNPSLRWNVYRELWKTCIGPTAVYFYTIDTPLEDWTWYNFTADQMVIAARALGYDLRVIVRNELYDPRSPEPQNHTHITITDIVDHHGQESRKDLWLFLSQKGSEGHWESIGPGGKTFRRVDL